MNVPNLQRRLLMVAVLSLLLLSACGEEDASGSEPTRAAPATETPIASAAPEPTPSPSPTATATGEASAPEFAAQVIGTIASVESRGDQRSIHIVEHPDDPNNGEQYIVGIPPSTSIVERTGAEIEPRTFDDLTTGMRVVVLFSGEVWTSYPGQMTAGEVVVIRTHTDGPVDPQDTVTVTFTMSLFTGFSPVMPTPLDGDAFYVSYSIGRDEERRHFFCGADGQAGVSCEGSGTTYELQVEIPRGAELRYSVHRIPEDDPEQVELVESGREVVDMDLASRSHYRYGAQNPGGYD